MKQELSACEKTREQIDGLSQKGLQAARRSGQIHGHVQQCASCRAYLEKALLLAGHLDSWQVPEPKEDLCARVMTEIAQVEHDRRDSLPMFLKQCIALLNVRLQVPAAAAAFLMVALVFSVIFNIKGIFHTAPAITGDTPSDNLAVVATPDDASTVVYSNINLPDQTGSYLNGAALAPSTFVVILGAPPSSTVKRLGEILFAASVGTAAPDEEGPPNKDSKDTREPGVHL